MFYLKKMFLILFLFLFLIGNAFAWTFNPITPNASNSFYDDINHYYNFEDNVLDQIGAVNGSASNLTYSTGLVGKTGVFNGTSSWVSISGATSSYNNTTISLLFQTDNNTSNRTLFERGVTSGCDPSSNFIYINLDGNLSTGIGCGDVIKTPINTNKIYHVVMTIDNSSLTSMYVNGEAIEIDFDTRAGQATSIGNDRIGRATNTVNNFWFDGNIDEVIIIEGAISEADLNDLINFYDLGITANFNYELLNSQGDLNLINNSSIGESYEIININWFLDDTQIGTGQSFVYESILPNTDYNFGMFVDSNVVDVNDWYYEVVNISNGLSFNFFDENSLGELDGVTYTISPSINGDSGGTLIDNNLDLNLTGITATTYTFTFTKTGYGTRYYITDLNQYSEIDINFALNPTIKSESIPFKVYQTDETTLFSNTYIELYLPSKNNWITGRQKTDSSGEVTFSISSVDQNYYANVNNGEFTYQPVALTILYPKDEETLQQIDGNWKIDITQNLYESYTELDTNKIIYLLPNTSNPYNIKIGDMNGNYFSRTYAQQYPGNPLTAILQPYLVSTETGLLTTITTKSGVTNLAVGGITIKIYKYIAGEGRTLVEQIITDDKGQALVLLILNGEYEFETYEDASFLKTFNINATSSSIYILLPASTTGIDINSSGFLTIFTPIGNGLNKINVGTKNFTQTLYNYKGDSYTATSEIIQNGVVLDSDTYALNDANITTFTRTVNWVDINNNVTIISRLTIVVNGETYVFEQKYNVNDAFGTNYNIINGLSQGLRSDFACSTTGICWTLLVLGIILSVIIGIYGSLLMGGFSGQTAGIIMLIFAIFFTYLTWIPFELTAALVIILLAFIINERRS